MGYNDPPTSQWDFMRPTSSLRSVFPTMFCWILHGRWVFLESGTDYLPTRTAMHGSTNFKSPPTLAEIHRSCDKVYHKHEVSFLLYIRGQIVT